MIYPVLILFIIFVFFRFEIALAIGISSMIGLIFFSHISILVLVQRLIIGVDSFVFLAIPLFVLAANLMNAGGITDRIFAFARVLVGHFRGGLGYANVLASVIFAGMSGSAVADAGGLGAIEMEAMNKQGYPKEFSASITIASSVIGPIIPPSIPMVIYAGLAEVSVGRLFMGGIIPGVLVAISLMIFVYFFSVKYNFPKDKKATFKESIDCFLKSFFPILTPAIILGGIVLGIFTPTEAAAVAVIYAFILSFFIYKTITLKDLPKILVESMITTAITMFIMATTSTFSYIMLLGRLSDLIVSFITAVTMNKYLVLFILNVFLLFFGCIMEAGVALILLVPILIPILNIVGIDPVHFGVVMVVNLMIGVVTPPVGMALFVVSHVSGIKVEKLMKAIIPFLLPEIIVLFLITYLPPLVTWIPNLIFGK